MSSVPCPLITPSALLSRVSTPLTLSFATTWIPQDGRDNAAADTRKRTTRPHTHSDSHGIFGGHSHSHPHGHDGHDHGGGLIETLQCGGEHLSHPHLCVLRCSHVIFFFRIASPFSLSPSIVSYRSREGDRGSRVTLVGLGANVL